MIGRKSARASRVRVALGSRSYDVWIGSGAIRRAAKGIPGKRAFIIADKKLVKARKLLRDHLAASGWEITEIQVKAGESLKDISAVYPLYGSLLKAGAGRDSVLFALGGGSVGDAAGFVAATYMRGITWVSIPTTLLGQVDSGIGGKTAINHAQGKNLIGAFHQPSQVICDIDFLKTLSPREVISGLGETVKYGLIYDPTFCTFLSTHLRKLMALEPAPLAAAIARAVRWKAKAVSKDELDLKGTREALNFGHTFGHALEALTGYRAFQHGEAVIWGMRFALALSKTCKILKESERQALDQLLCMLPIPPLPDGLSPRALFTCMRKDKKARNGKIRFVLLEKPGKTVNTREISEQELARAFRRLIQL
ncbi:MAG: 3-dehydroquinate synthase [Oligoflexia bacterium]|nr:3-dehydroquinate synthase [Oligoflexia bacterium]